MLFRSATSYVTEGNYPDMESAVLDARKFMDKKHPEFAKQFDTAFEQYKEILANPKPETTESATPKLSRKRAGKTATQDAGEFDEQKFQSWYGDWADRAGIDPDPDNPLHNYDYRAAFKAGAEPSISKEDGRYHWPSQFKEDDHPNRFVDGVDTKTGRSISAQAPSALPPRNSVMGRSGGKRITGRISMTGRPGRTLYEDGSTEDDPYTPTNNAGRAAWQDAMGPAGRQRFVAGIESRRPMVEAAGRALNTQPPEQEPVGTPMNPKRYTDDRMLAAYPGPRPTDARIPLGGLSLY